MKDRMDALGGTIENDSVPGSGENVRGTLPVRELEVVG
jgi:signal transduction histidine kinase